MAGGSVTVELPIAVAIPKAELGKGFLGLPSTELGRGLIGQSSTFFIEVVALGLQSQVQRSWEDFEKLHADISLLIRGFPSEVRLRLSYALQPLPTSSWFADSAKVLEERRTKLEAMLQKLLPQPEVVYDQAERLWRFLGLHAAVTSAIGLAASPTCGPLVRKLWEASSEGQGLIPLQHPSVEESLLKLVSSGLGEDGSIAGREEESSLSLACGLLQRIFTGAGGSQKPEELLKRRLETLVSLLLSKAPARGEAPSQRQPEEARSQDPGVRDASGCALLALAKADRGSWQRALCSYLSASALRSLIAVVEMRGGSDAEGELSTERLIAELLLRGFDGPVMECFMEPGLGIERKQLLNSLFASQDLFVKVAVGLLLARLLCQPDYAEAEKAELGLAALCRELGPRGGELASAGLREVLLEPEPWSWLSRIMASCHPMVSGFALLVMVNAVQPTSERVMGTPGMRDSLAALVQPESDGTVKSLAAGTLLAAFRADDSTIPSSPGLVSAVCRALAFSSERAVARQAQEHEGLCATAAELRERYGRAAGLTELTAAACENAEELRMAVETWRLSLSGSSESLELSEHITAACVACLGSHRAYRGAAVSNLDDEDAETCCQDPGQELLLGKSTLEEEQRTLESGTREMERLVQEKMDLTRQVSECTEEVHKWQAAASYAEEGGGPVDLASCRPRLGALEGASQEECAHRHRRAVESLKVLRTQVDLVDSRLQELSEALPALRVSTRERTESIRELSTTVDAQRRRHTGLLLEWGKVMDAGATCDAELRNFAGRLGETRQALRAESASRARMRQQLQGLVASLMALDQELESLDAREG